MASIAIMEITRLLVTMENLAAMIALRNKIEEINPKLKMIIMSQIFTLSNSKRDK